MDHLFTGTSTADIKICVMVGSIPGNNIAVEGNTLAHCTVIVVIGRHNVDVPKPYERLRIERKAKSNEHSESLCRAQLATFLLSIPLLLLTLQTARSHDP
jgi:hypothetical protein